MEKESDIRKENHIILLVCRFIHKPSDTKMKSLIRTRVIVPRKPGEFVLCLSETQCLKDFTGLHHTSSFPLPHSGHNPGRTSSRLWRVGGDSPEGTVALPLPTSWGQLLLTRMHTCFCFYAVCLNFFSEVKIFHTPPSGSLSVLTTAGCDRGSCLLSRLPVLEELITPSL